MSFEIDLITTQSPEYTIASGLILLSIIFSGILIGVGRGLQNRKIQSFGFEELIEAIINSAILGGFALILIAITTITTEIVPQFEEQDDILFSDGSTNLIDFCNFATNTPDHIDYVKCNIFAMEDQMYLNIQKIEKLNSITSYYSDFSIDFGHVNLIPFKSFRYFNENVYFFQKQLIFFNVLNRSLSSFLNLIKPNFINFLFPLGLILRALFFTRKLGGLLIGISISFYILFPFGMIIFSNYQDLINKLYATSLEMEEIINNENIQTIPLVEISSSFNETLIERFDNISQMNLVDLKIIIYKSLNSIISTLSIIAFFIPFFSFLICAFFARILGLFFGQEHIILWRQI